VFGRAKFGSWKRAMIGGQSLVWKEENVSKREECSAKEGKSGSEVFRKLTCKGTLRHVFICLRPRISYPPPLVHCMRVYSILIHKGNGEGGES
jgi:hypothetical protein